MYYIHYFDTGIKIVNFFINFIKRSLILKTINLISLLDASEELSSDLFETYKSQFGISIKNGELNVLKSFVRNLAKFSNKFRILENYFVGYTIPQISKEFDLLRFYEDKIINIELKSQSTLEKTHKQLLGNKYYLTALKKEIYQYTYVEQEEKLYKIENDNVVEAQFTELLTILNDGDVHTDIDLNKVFIPSNYLVSPFNSTKEFISGNYFLTDHQVNIKSEIVNDSTTKFFSIQGAAGTGKTLVTYDIAKEYKENERKVLIFHCGKLNEGQHNLNQEYDWEISMVKNWQGKKINEYDLIIFDEVQRIRTNQLEKICDEIIKASHVKCIFSYDENQCLSSIEINNNIPDLINKVYKPKRYKLKNKIRTNYEIAEFIKSFFNSTKPVTRIEYPNISVQYFKRNEHAQRKLTILSREEWKIINYTSSLYDSHPYDKLEFKLEKDTAHTVIGQEFEKVAVVIDSHFSYDEIGNLSIYGDGYYYDPVKMLFQMITRARTKLMIVVIDNPNVLKRITDITIGNKEVKV